MIFAAPICKTILEDKQTVGILVSIVIPALNEEGNLGNVLVDLKNFVEQSRLSNEIIVVNDGSTDKTKEIAIQNGAKVISNRGNQGKGYSLKCGFKSARGEIIVTMDADGSHDPKDIAKLILPILNGFDIAIGSRFNTEKGRQTTTQVNLFGNRLINLVFRIITGTVVTDTQSGFRAYKSKVLKEIIINSKGYEIETELTLKPIINGYSLKEVPIFVRPRVIGVSRLNPLKDGLKILKRIIQVAFIQE